MFYAITLENSAISSGGVKQNNITALKSKQSLLDPYQLCVYLNNKLVLHYIAMYSKCNELPRLLKRSEKQIQHIAIELKKRNLPKELLLLPIIESSYRDQAISQKGAKGIWQISYITGKRFGLIKSQYNQLHDHRHDLVASTAAALSYLELLYCKFNGNWLLALASYNAGEGRISRAIQYNQKRSMPTNYWHLELPKETIHYVPKLLALAIIFNNPVAYGVNFKPYD